MVSKAVCFVLLTSTITKSKQKLLLDIDIHALYDGVSSRDSKDHEMITQDSRDCQLSKVYCYQVVGNVISVLSIH